MKLLDSDFDGLGPGRFGFGQAYAQDAIGDAGFDLICLQWGGQAKFTPERAAGKFLEEVFIPGFREFSFDADDVIQYLYIQVISL